MDAPNEEQETQFMREALIMAEEALGCGEVPVGCVVVDEEGRIISRGRNRTNETRNATRHAELEALQPLLQNDSPHRQANMDRLRLYVTVEPCIMCAAALRLVGLTQIYFGCYNERFGGCGSIIPIHEDFIPSQIDPPLQISMLRGFRRECVGLLRRFYLRQNERAPKPRDKARRLLKEELE